MDPVQITPKAIQDIAKLAQGVDRVKVALNVLKEALEGSNLSPGQVKKLRALLKKVSPTEGAACATKSEAVAELKLVGGLKLVDCHPAVEGKITLKITIEKQLDTLLLQGSFNKRPWDQKASYPELGYRMASREEHLAYLEDLLAKEGNDTINDAEKYVLKSYRKQYVRDIEGGLGVVGRFVADSTAEWIPLAFVDDSALFVRASAESK